MTSKRRSFILLIFIIKCISKCSLTRLHSFIQIHLFIYLFSLSSEIAKMSFKIPLMIILVCLCVVSAQDYICGRAGGFPCPWKGDQPERGEIFQNAAENYTNAWRNKKAHDFVHMKRTLYKQKQE